MAAIDKLYGNKDQYMEFSAWCKANKPALLTRFYVYDDEMDMPSEVFAVANFSEKDDAWLLANCPLEWVKKQIRAQYGEAVR